MVQGVAPFDGRLTGPHLHELQSKQVTQYQQWRVPDDVNPIGSPTLEYWVKTKCSK